MVAQKQQLDAARKGLAELQGKLTGQDLQGSCTVFLHSKAGRDKADHWKRMKFDAALTTSFRNGVLTVLKKCLESKDEVEPYAYDDMVSGHIGFWPREENQGIKDWLEAVPNTNWPHAFDGNDKFLQRVNFHATVVPVGGTELTIFRHRGSASLLHKGGLMATFDTTQHQFKRLTDRVFHFDHGVDFILWGDFVYITDHGKFESLTHIREVTVAKASHALTQLQARKDIAIEKIDAITAKVIQKPLLARRLASADHMDVLDALTGQAMVERIKTLKLPIKHSKVGKEYRFTVDPDQPNEVKELINLITDYYLRSPLTKKEYRVPSKYPLNAAE